MDEVDESTVIEFSTMARVLDSGFLQSADGSNNVSDNASGNPMDAVDADRLVKLSEDERTSNAQRRVSTPSSDRMGYKEAVDAVDALRRSKQQLQRITDAVPLLVAYIDAQGRYAFASASYNRWFGYDPAELLGQPLSQVMGEKAYAAIYPHVLKALAGESVTYQAEVPYLVGGMRAIEATYVPQVDAAGNPNGFVALVADITERKSLEDFRIAAAERAERLLKITAALADAVTTVQVFEAVVDQVAEVIDASSAALWLIDEDRVAASLVRVMGYTKAMTQQLSSLRLDLEPSIPALDSMRSGHPIWIASQSELLERYPHLKSSVSSGRSYRVSCLPLIAQGRTLGTLALTIEDTQAASADERDFLLLVARYASQALERLRLWEAERRSRAQADAAAARMTVLSQASRVFVETQPELSSRLSGVVAELGTMLNSCVGITLLQPDGLLHACAVYHPDPEADALLRSLSEQVPLKPGEGVSGTVVSTGQSMLIAAANPEELAARVAPSHREFLQRYPMYAMLCTPLRARGQVIGTVTATRTRHGESYESSDLKLFEELADRAASAIENSRLYQENLNARSRAEQLYRFAQAVVLADRVEQVFEAALDAIERALGTDRAAILVFDDKNVMRFRAHHRLSDKYRSAVEGHSPWSQGELSPAPVLVPDIASDAKLSAFLPIFCEEGIGSLAFFPLVSRGRLLGKFMVYYRESHQYTSHEVKLASAIGNHLASVIVRFDAINKLEETIRYNELFAGVLAHDLRNPLGAMMMAAQHLLMRQDEGDKSVKPLGRILTSGQRMTRMIDQLLDFTRARAGGGIEIRPTVANLAEVCMQAVGELELGYPEWKIQRVVLGDQNGSWDPDRLLQIFSNLVANAGQHGNIEDGIRLTLDGRAADGVRFEVHNTGAIPDTLLSSLFDPFRGTHYRKDHSRGLGLGLFIVRELVRAHGGAVGVVSSEETGTTFTVQLPRYVHHTHNVRGSLARGT